MAGPVWNTEATCRRVAAGAALAYASGSETWQRHRSRRYLLATFGVFSGLVLFDSVLCRYNRHLRPRRGRGSTFL